MHIIGGSRRIYGCCQDFSERLEIHLFLRRKPSSLQFRATAWLTSRRLRTGNEHRDLPWTHHLDASDGMALSDEVQEVVSRHLMRFVRWESILRVRVQVFTCRSCRERK